MLCYCRHSRALPLLHAAGLCHRKHLLRASVRQHLLLTNTRHSQYGTQPVVLLTPSIAAVIEYKICFHAVVCAVSARIIRIY